MITKEFLSQCSEEQINKGVAWLEASKLSIFDVEFDIPWRISEHEVISSYGRKFFSCHNPNETMPIAFANKIAVMPNSDGSWKSGCLPSNPERTFGWANFVNGYTNPLRAICEVYILMSVNK